ncbi:MAG: RNA 2',3'-cyclic phosphodiesterase [Elusimicrobiota bacterium]
MRLFFALEVGEPAAGTLRGALEDLRGAGPDVKWVRTETFHMTLAFLGELPAERLEPAARAARRLRGRQGPVRMAFDRLGAFPDWRSPRVLWAGLGEGAEPLSAAARILQDALADEGFALEKRSFHPHATLGRVRSPRRLGPLRRRAERWRDARLWDEAAFEAGGIALFESRLSSEGPSYRAIERFPLPAP